LHLEGEPKMVKDNNFIKESSSIIEEIEAQLQDVLAKKREKVQHELEEKIKAEQEEAQKRISQIEDELKGNKEALENYKNVLSQFENDKQGVKQEIKAHLDVAIQLQTDIEKMTSQTLQELKTVSELTKKLEEINHEASTKVNALRVRVRIGRFLIREHGTSTARTVHRQEIYPLWLPHAIPGQGAPFLPIADPRQFDCFLSPLILLTERVYLVESVEF